MAIWSDGRGNRLRPGGRRLVAGILLFLLVLTGSAPVARFPVVVGILPAGVHWLRLGGHRLSVLAGIFLVLLVLNSGPVAGILVFLVLIRRSARWPSAFPVHLYGM